MRRPLLALAAAAALTVSAAACGESATTSKNGVTSIDVGVIPISDVAPIYLGQKKGFFDEQKLKLNLKPAQGGAAIVPGVVSGDLEFGFSNVVSLLLAQSKGLPVKVVTNGISSSGEEEKDFASVIVKDDSKIQKPKDLAGKKVAINTLNNAGDTQVRASVRKDGGDAKSIKFVEMPFPDMSAALDKGDIDAVWIVEPFQSQLLADGNRIVATPAVDTAEKLTHAVYFTTTKTAQTDQDLVKRFQAAMNKSLEYADSHPDEARAILATYTKIKGDQAKDMVLPKWPVEINRESVQAQADLAVSDGLIKGDKKPDVNALLP
ncbi:MAG: nitrate ABC transporter substrate-binding protein [Streptosporangiales bacterium]|nr:nitrate ABC transporter substrate-binding protein [Streptosporangiales bacterium]